MIEVRALGLHPLTLPNLISGCMATLSLNLQQLHILGQQIGGFSVIFAFLMPSAFL